MHDEHLTAKRLKKLLEEGASEEQNRLLIHHLALCPDCYQVGGYILDLYRAQAIGLAFCTVDLELARSRAEAPALWEKLSAFPKERREGLIHDLPRFQTWGLAEHLCSMSQQRVAHAPEEALHFAELAVEVSFLLKEWQPAESSWLSELRALSLGYLANARRVMSNLREAESVFEQADKLWEEGESDVGVPCLGISRKRPPGHG